jgi:hypothetical protein
MLDVLAVRPLGAAADTLVELLIGAAVVRLGIVVGRPGLNLVFIDPDLVLLDPSIETMQFFGSGVISRRAVDYKPVFTVVHEKGAATQNIDQTR